MTPSVSRVATRHLSGGSVVPFPQPKRRPHGKVYRLHGEEYVLSTDGGPLGDPEEDEPGWFGEGGARLIDVPHPEPWRFLWVLDTDKDYVAMWRVTDGNEKAAGRATHFQSTLMKLDRKGQINRVSHEEFLAIEREMRRLENSHLRDLQEAIEESKTEYQRVVDKVALEVYEKEIEPVIEDRIEEVLAGVHPFGFEVNERLLDHAGVEDQAITFVISQEHERYTTQMVDKELRRRGMDPEAPGVDIQATYWAVHEVMETKWEQIRNRYRTRTKTAATFTLNVGDPVLYGKYKNKRGIIKEFGVDAKGNPTITVEPVPKGRKQDKVMGLFKVWYDKETAAQQAGVPAPLPSPVRVASRWLDAGLREDFPENHKKFLGALADVVSTLEYMDQKGITQNRYMTNGPLVNLAIRGSALVQSVMATKAVPKGKEKALEMAARAVMAMRRAPKDARQWFARNKRFIDLLVDTVRWSDLGEETEAKFKVGPFTVHNTLNLTGPDLAGIKAVLARVIELAKSTAFPSNFERVLYGDVFFTGQITRKSTVVAQYFYQEDALYVRPTINSGFDDVQATLHELAHRYWAKFAPQDNKVQWHMHHSDVEHGVSYTGLDVKYPQVGDEVSIVKPVGRGSAKKQPVVVKIVGDPHRGVGAKFYVDTGGYVTSSQYLDVAYKTKVRSSFPTPYSSTNAEEHFCEAAALLALGRLPEQHQRAFEQVWR